MRVSIYTAAVCALACAGIACVESRAQNGGPLAGSNAAAVGREVRVATATPAAGQPAKFRFILFWKEDDQATRAMAEALKNGLAQRAERAEWTAINVKDPAQRPVVDRYRVERAPMPMVLCVAPNGAITGGIRGQVIEAAAEGALVTPGKGEAAGACQYKRRSEERRGGEEVRSRWAPVH